LLTVFGSFVVSGNQDWLTIFCGRTMHENILPVFGLNNRERYIKGGQTALAEKAFQRAWKASLIIRRHVNLAILWKNEGKLEEAYSLIKNFRETKIWTFSAEIYYNMGAIFASKGILDWAIFHYGQAVNRLPDYPEAHFNLALVYRRAGKKVEAKQSFQRFLDYWRGPSNSPFVAEAKSSIQELAIQ
jgi:tetratricopeptide (TPR) repeat protein